MQVTFANEHEDKLCRALLALRDAAGPWASLSDVPMSWNVARSLVRRKWVLAQSGKRFYRLTESGRGMAALIASLLKV